MNINSKALSIAVGLSLLTACTAISSKPTSTTKDAAAPLGTDYTLPAGQLKLSLEKVKTVGQKIQFFLTISPPTIVADSSSDANFTLSYEASATSSDTLLIEKTTAGLLQKIHFSSDEKSGELVVKVVDLGKAIFKKIPTPVGALLIAKNGEKSLIYSAEFDPFDTTEMASVFKAASDASKAVTPDNDVPLYLTAELKFNGTNVSSLDAQPSEFCGTSICYRKLATFDFLIRNGGIEFMRRRVSLPDKTRLSRIDITRAAFVVKKTNLDFTNGMLTKVDIEKPSEALAFVQIPIDITNSLLAIPGELVKLKIDTTEDTEELHEARKAEIDAKLQLLKKEQEITDYLSDPTKTGGDSLLSE